MAGDIAIVAVGSILAVLVSSNGDNIDIETGSYILTGAGVVGFILEIAAIVHLGNAGKHIMNHRRTEKKNIIYFHSI
jgi:hypothetical protein